MQEGFEMAPSDDQPILTTRSPTCSPPLPSSLIKSRKNNDSQQSLFYSSSTCRQDTHRSPRFINLPILQSQKPKIKIEGLKPLKQRVAEKFSKSNGNKHGNVGGDEKEKEQELKIQQQQQQQQQQQREKNGRIRELEEALRSETLVAEELRGKISLMTELIEKGFKQTELAEYLKSRNSSKTMSHIDIFLELQHLRNELSSTLSKLSPITTQNTKLKSLISSLQSTLLSKESQIKQQHILLQQNQSLSIYVEEFQKKYNILSKQNDANIAQIKLLEQSVGTQESMGVKELEESVRFYEEEIERLKHEREVVEGEWELRLESVKEEYCGILLEKDEEIVMLRYEAEELEGKVKKLEGGGGGLRKQEAERLKWELENCVKEREYYHEEYLKKIKESAEFHEVRLKHKAEVEFLREKIERREKERDRENREGNRGYLVETKGI